MNTTEHMNILSALQKYLYHYKQKIVQKHLI